MWPCVFCLPPQPNGHLPSGMVQDRLSGLPNANANRSVLATQFLEEDKRATTNVQNGLVFFSLFSLVSFPLFELKQ